MNPCHISQTRPRSRSPSPVPHHRFAREDQDHNQSKDSEDTQSSASNSKSDTLLDVDDRTIHRFRSHSWRNAKLNQHLVNSHPVHLLVNTDGPSSPSFNFISHSDRELLVAPTRTRRHSDGEMSDPIVNGLITNYGSLNSNLMTSSENEAPPSPQEDPSRPPSPRLKRQKSYYTPAMTDELRKRNRLYFMDPITKLRHFHGFPWKLTLQLVKLILITGQIIIFGGQRASIVDYFERSEIAFKHLLLLNWDPSFETMPYPPATGQYAIYTIPDLFDHMNYVMQQYYTLPETSLAAITLEHYNKSEPVPLELCFKANSYFNIHSSKYLVSAKLLENCTYVYPLGDPGNYTFDVAAYLDETGFVLPFNRTLEITLKFYLTTFHLNLLETHYGPTCYNVSIEVKYKNSERSGQLLTTLDANPSEIGCKSTDINDEAKDELSEKKTQNIVYDSFVMGICTLSIILCSRSLHRSNKLRANTAKYFRLHRGKPFSFSNHMEYINVWYILIICNDILTTVGSCFKIQLESRVFSISSHNYQVCSVFLGLGILLTFVGILRYLGFFKSYNVLILTLKTSFPHVMRFLVCALCLYAGFMFCGWVVFSPYHIKFRELSTTSECLFSLVNGDDMFVTFSALTTDSYAIWYFHRAYLYVFISLFIYVVLSVFIAVIMDNYENLKYWYEKGFPDTEVEKFIKEGGEMTKAELFSHVRRGHSCANWFFCIFPCLACLRSSLKDKNQEGLSQNCKQISYARLDFTSDTIFYDQQFSPRDLSLWCVSRLKELKMHHSDKSQGKNYKSRSYIDKNRTTPDPRHLRGHSFQGVGERQHLIVSI